MTTWRAVYDDNKPAAWLPKPGHSGVYVFKDRETGAVLYVGESHSGKLRRTMLRHFQHWTAGATYDAATVVAAVHLTTPERAVELQNRLIARMVPRDNEAGLTFWGRVRRAVRISPDLVPF